MNHSVQNSITYRDAGVDIDAAAKLVDMLKPMVRRTARTGVVGGIGGFAGLFDLKLLNYQDPLLASTCDGVGTKVKIAAAVGNLRGVGIDLVAMNVNDLICVGAEPLFLLDYYATGHLQPALGAALIDGIADGCQQAGCALLGGETSEMPGIYDEDDFDVAGFAVGVVERSQLLPRSDVAAGDVLLGLPASGLHSNGFSLVRRLMADHHFSYDQPAGFMDAVGGATPTLGEVLLTPTRIYVQQLLPLIKAGRIKALAHITGGGILENLPRVLPQGLTAVIDVASWPKLPVMQWLMQTSGMQATEAARTFNLGIGMILVVSPAEAEALLAKLAGKMFRIGQLTDAAAGQPAVRLNGLEALSL
jgi:phosphoribosylformylglycinamidine cyclo-ligase